MKHCRICHKSFENLQSHLKKHKISVKIYRELFDIRGQLSYKRSRETLRKLSCSMKGKRNFLGKHHTLETIEKIREAKLGDKNPAKRVGVRRKISLTQKGKHNSPRTEFDGSLKYWLGKHRRLETIAKIRKARLKQKIPKKDTKIEILVKERLVRKKIDNWIGNYPVKGQPDIAFPDRKIAIFCDGCYWHNCPICGFSNSRARNNDGLVNEELERKGWKVLRFWGHEIKQNPDSVILKIEEALNCE